MEIKEVFRERYSGWRFDRSELTILIASFKQSGMIPNHSITFRIEPVREEPDDIVIELQLPQGCLDEGRKGAEEDVRETLQNLERFVGDYLRWQLFLKMDDQMNRPGGKA